MKKKKAAAPSAPAPAAAAPSTAAQTACSSTSISNKNKQSNVLPTSYPSGAVVPDDDFAHLSIHQDDAYTIPLEHDRSDILESKPVQIFRSHKDVQGSPFHGFFPPGSKAPSMVFLDPDVERIRAAVNWPAWNVQVTAIPKEERCFVLRKKKGGKAIMFASRQIQPGDMIIKERPYMILHVGILGMVLSLCIPEVLTNALSRLGEKQRRIVSATCAPGEKVDHTVSWLIKADRAERQSLPKISAKNLSDCLPVNLDGNRTALHYLAAFDYINYNRLTPSCAPNANLYLQKAIDCTGRLYATRRIEAGEAITFTSANLIDTKADRQKHLSTLFEAHCNCSVCCLPEEQSKISEEKRAFIKLIQNLLDDRKHVKVEHLQKAIRFAEEEGLPSVVVRLKQTGAGQLVMDFTAASMRQALQWAKEVEKSYIMLEGKDSIHAKETREMLSDLGHV